jgi:indole-3-glycerol phosphate synthase
MAEGLAGLSVLTEREFFHGGERLFSEFRSMIGVPMIYKDFVVSPDQIDAASKLGADAILLISTMLSHDALRSFVDRSIAKGLEPLVEVHDQDDLDKVIASGVMDDIKLIGINSRDLRTLDTDLRNAIELRHLLPEGIQVIAESGVKTPRDIERLTAFDAALVGTMFMTAEDLRSSVHDAAMAARSLRA